MTTPIVYSVPGMDHVQVHLNRRYRPDEDGNLLLDAYVPHGLSRSDRRPVVLLLHGGVPPGVLPKDWPLFQTWGRLLAASGFVGITFNHRLGYPRANLVQAGADVRAAIAHARDNAETLHVDRDRVFGARRCTRTKDRPSCSANSRLPPSTARKAPGCRRSSLRAPVSMRRR